MSYLSELLIDHESRDGQQGLYLRLTFKVKIAQSVTLPTRKILACLMLTSFRTWKNLLVYENSLN